MASRASFTHSGQSESVCRGQPSVGFVFSHDFFSGLSDHCGVNEAPGRMRFRRLNTNHAALAETAIPFSRYLAGACTVILQPSQATNLQNAAPISRKNKPHIGRWQGSHDADVNREW